MATQYRAAVIGLGRMGSTFDDEKSRVGSGAATPCPHALLSGCRRGGGGWGGPA